MEIGFRGWAKSPPFLLPRARQNRTGETKVGMDLEETEAQIEALIEPEIMRLGYELVRIQLAGARQGLTLQIMAERQDRKGMRVEDCTVITRALDGLLEANDLIPGAYALEVSSPGIDRPLTREKDFAEWAGFEAKIELRHMLDGRKNFRGKLIGLKDGVVQIKIDSAVIDLPLTAIAKARLVMTDALLKATMEREKAAQAATT